ncbi:MAG: hypothetical protein RhofKO_22720 [Rhodothermales bacterium]
MKLSPKLKRALIAIGILVGAIVLAVVLVQMREAPPTQPPAPRTPLVQTVPAEVRSGRIEVAGAGTVRARDEAAVAAQVSGRVTYVAPELESGGRVRQGQVLVRIDAADFENRVAQAQADVAAQDVAVLQAEEEAALAREEFDRFAAREAARTPFASVDADDYAARVLPQQNPTATTPATPREPSALTLRKPQLDAARAARQRATASLSDAELALSRTEVRAPFNGIVRTETVAVGDVIGAAQPFARIIATNSLEAIIPLSDDQAALIPNLYTGGATAAVYADYGRLRYRWDAVVDRVDATLDEAARTFNVVLRVPSPLQGGRRVDPVTTGDRGAEPAIIPNAAPPLLVGTYVDAILEGAELDTYAVIPRRALRRGGTIWTVEQNGSEAQLRIVPVAIVQEVGEQLFVTGNLASGTPIVTTDLTGVVDGMTVRLAEAAISTDTAASIPTN